MFTLAGVTCITGACSVIGKATQSAFASSGCTNFILIDHSRTELDELVHNLKQCQPSTTIDTRVCDPQNVEEIELAIGTGSRQSISYFVNCSYSQPQPCHTLEIDPWDFKTTLNELQRATWIAMRAQVRHAVSQSDSDSARPTSIVNIVAVQGHAAQPRFPAYAAANSGIIGSSKNVALDSINSNIRVNCICHGAVNTPTLALSSRQRALAEAPPASATVKAEHIAAAAVYLSSEPAQAITGTCLILDGGWSLSHV